MKNIKIEISDENIGYYSLYREPEVAYIELNKNRPHFTDSEIERGLERPFEEYSAADQRCFGVAFACIDKRMKFINRKKFNKPIILSGRKIERSKYVEGGYLYNRCHLIGCQLHPFKNDKKNFIIGTRYFNMKGMFPFENKVKDYVENGGHVLYRVKPYFKEKNTLAYGVQMEALSIINAYYGQRAELIRANGAAVRSKRRKPSCISWDSSYFFHSVLADRLYVSSDPDRHQRRYCLRTVHTMS